MHKIMDRVKEPSTYAGAAAMAYGVGELFKIKEAAPAADAIAQAGQAVAGGADPMTAGIMAVAGFLAMVMRERGRR